MRGSRHKSRIHEGLVGDRHLVGSPYLADANLRREYESEIAPRTRAALARILSAQWPGRTGVARALDLGAGTGAAGQAITAHFGGKVELVSVDRVAGPGIVVADVRRTSRPAGVVGQFDLVIAAHLLNELAPSLDVAKRANLVAAWCRELLTEGGRCLVLEPALRATSRELLQVRDLLVARGLHIAAPCFTQGPCPALANEKDWCHDASTGEGGRRIDFSYLVVGDRGGGVADKAAPNLYRVVSDSLPEKGRLRLFVCGAEGRHAVVRLTRDRTGANHDLDEARRGDVIAIGGPVWTMPGGEVRLCDSTPVTRGATSGVCSMQEFSWTTKGK